MALPELVSDHLPTALVATIVLFAIKAITGGLAAPPEAVTRFGLYLGALFSGFVIVDLVWKHVIRRSGA